MRIGSERGPQRLWILATTLLLVGAACSGPPGSVAPVASPGAGGSIGATDSSVPSADPGDPGDPSSSVPPRGNWQGTISFHAVVDQKQDDSETSGQGTYQVTTVEHSVTQLDVTDAFTVTGLDGEDRTFGLGSVDLAGTVANQGTTLERAVFVSDKHNALGCHYSTETGTEVKGSWSGNAAAAGSIRFSEDGTYQIDIAVGGDPVTGESPPSPLLPKRLWDTAKIIEGATKDCPGPGLDLTDTGAPSIQWASSATGAYDSIDGTLGAGTPGAVLDGTKTFDTKSPIGKVTVTWHLVHDGPIVLPHS